ncbi:MAG: hypothetical protein ABIO80_02060 [Sphingomicrobium sp.]
MPGRFAIALLTVTSLLGACSHAGVITSLSTDYNKAISDVRNQQLLLNIMRSSAREPLQFSAMGEIAATVHRSIGVDTMLNNLIVGGAAAINHSVNVEARNEPVIKIAPLSDKEFISGILKPTTPETLKDFMELGWDPEFMLPLIVAGYRCPGGEYQANSGKPGEGEAARRALVDAAASLHLVERKTAGVPVTLVVRDDQALEMIRSGVNGGFKVKSVQPASEGGTSEVRLAGPDKQELVAMINLCGNAPGSAAMTGGTRPVTAMEFADDAAANIVEPAGPTASAEPRPGQIKLRSVEAIIYFLGESYRDCYLRPRSRGDCALSYRKDGADRYLFRVSTGGSPAGRAAVATQFYGTNYWVSRLDPNDVDRTMKTFSFLDELVALQIEPSAISTTPTVLSIGAH